MEQSQKLKQGDFSQLAEMYALYRPSYSPSVLNAILGLMEQPTHTLRFADVGAGTGIWTRMVANKGIQAIAIEPNAEMRAMGKKTSQQLNIKWLEGSGEATGLEANSIDLLSMASSFHWVDFEKGTQEFHRVLRPGGRFVALWNPRLIEDNPLLIEIEQKIHALCPTMQRVSSGKSDYVNQLSKRLLASPLFEDLVYLEGRHTVKLTPGEYIGVWNSVNDVRAQMGELAFAQFIQFITDKVSHLPYIECTYLTRAWMVKRK